MKNNDEKNQELVLKNDDDEQTNTNENTEDSTQTNEQGESKNYSNRFDRDLEEFNNRNKETSNWYTRLGGNIKDFGTDLFGGDSGTGGNAGWYSRKSHAAAFRWY